MCKWKMSECLYTREKTSSVLAHKLLNTSPLALKVFRHLFTCTYILQLSKWLNPGESVDLDDGWSSSLVTVLSKTVGDWSFDGFSGGHLQCRKRGTVNLFDCSSYTALKMAVETSVVNSLSQDWTNLDDLPPSSSTYILHLHTSSIQVHMSKCLFPSAFALGHIHFKKWRNARGKWGFITCGWLQVDYLNTMWTRWDVEVTMPEYYNLLFISRKYTIIINAYVKPSAKIHSCYETYKISNICLNRHLGFICSML